MKRLVGIVALIMLCLNVFCSSGACAYADLSDGQFEVSDVADNLPDGADDCCALCADGHCFGCGTALLLPAALVECAAVENVWAVDKRRNFVSAVPNVPLKPPCAVC